MEAGRRAWAGYSECEDVNTGDDVRRVIANTRELYTDELVRLTREVEKLNKYKSKYNRIKREFEGIKQEFETGIRSWEREDKSKSFIISAIKRILQGVSIQCGGSKSAKRRKSMKRRKTKRRIKKS